jgi:DNA-binding XRE family transcriptional regulator
MKAALSDTGLLDRDDKLTGRKRPGPPPGTQRYVGPTEAKLLRARHRAVRIPLIRAREKMEKSRPQLAAEIGVSRTYLFAVETGLRDPSLATMDKWIRALGPGASMDLFAKASG